MSEDLVFKDPDAERANLLYARAQRRGSEMINAMIELGEWLYAKKRELGHGAWLPFARLLDFSEDTAEICIRLYRNKAEVLDAKPYTIVKALAAISGKKKARTPKPTSLVRKLTMAQLKAVERTVANLPKDQDELKSELRIQVFELLRQLPPYAGTEIFCKFRFGQRLRDWVSGFTGIFTGLNQDLGGSQYCWLTPAIDTDGNYVNEQSFSAATLEVVDDGIAREILA